MARKARNAKPDLESEEEWDFENAERRPGIQSNRTVVSVAFPRDDFALVAEEAERAHLRLSEFIRAAALKEARHQRGLATVFSTSGAIGFASFTVTPQTVTQGRARLKTEDLVATS